MLYFNLGINKGLFEPKVTQLALKFAESKQKIVTAPHFVPIATGPPSCVDGDDFVVYERNIQSVKELAKPNPNSNRVYQLLKLTHSTGRSKIEHCDLCASQLKEEYPFFGSKNR